MNIYIKVITTDIGDGSPACSIQSLKLFSLHKSSFDEDKKIFIHYFLVIGYAGGGCQEECFYKIEGSNMQNSAILISTSAGDIYYQYLYSGRRTVAEETELTEVDTNIQNQFIEVANNYLMYNEDMCFYFLNNNSLLGTNGLLTTNKFPIQKLKFLNNVYWPFSTYW